MRNYSQSDLRALTGNLGAVLPAPKVRRNLESEMQRALIKWWRVACRGFGVPEILLFSIPNGGGGGEMRGYWLKMEGQRKGVPDLFLAVGRWRNKMVNGVVTADSASGLFLELKTPVGRLSTEQEIYHGALRASGYRVEVVRTLEEGIETITKYLKP